MFLVLSCCSYSVESSNAWVQMKARLLVKLAARVDRLAERLMELKLIFPTANVSLMVSRAPGLALMDDLEKVREGVASFQEQLPDADLDM